MNWSFTWVAPVPSRSSLSPVGSRRSTPALTPPVAVRQKLYFDRTRMSPSPVADPDTLSVLTVAPRPSQLWMSGLAAVDRRSTVERVAASSFTRTIGNVTPTSKRSVTP